MSHFINVQQLDQVIDELCTKNEARYLKSANLLNYTIKKEATADTGYLATYRLYSVNNSTDPATETAVGEKINVPKDFLVKSANIDVVTAADKASGGKFENDSNFAEGDKYIDFVVNVKVAVSGDPETDEHIYLNVADLMSPVTAGNGIEISAANAISLKIDSSNANGLSVTASGLKLDLATANTISYVAATGTYQTGTTYYTDSTGATEVDTTSFTDGVTDVSSYYVAQVTQGKAGAMSASDKTKLDGIQEATASEITAIINGMYATV